MLLRLEIAAFSFVGDFKKTPSMANSRLSAIKLGAKE